MSNIVRWCVLCMIGLGLGINVYLMNASHLMHNDMPMPFGYGASVILSGSMEPTLSIDDLIIVKEMEEYNVGDIVVYQNGGMNIVHRIIEINEQSVVTQGDANNASDGEVEFSAIKGKVIFSIPAIGAFIQVLKSPISTVVMICLSLWLTEMSFKGKKDSDEEKLALIREEIRKLKEE